MKNKKSFLALISIFALCSCESIFFEWSSFFNNHPWTKWVSKDGIYTIHCEYPNCDIFQNNCYYLTYKNNDQFEEGLTFLSSPLPKDKSDIYFVLNNENIISFNKKRNGKDSFKLKSKSKTITMKSTIIKEEEIVSKYITSKYLVLNDGEWILSLFNEYNLSLSSEMDLSKTPMFYESFYKGKYIKLYFNDDNTFSFEMDGLFSHGMSYPDYKKIVLKFISNSIFDTSDDLIFYYDNSFHQMNFESNYGVNF